jgi:hypothetical protein
MGDSGQVYWEIFLEDRETVRSWSQNGCRELRAYVNSARKPVDVSSPMVCSLMRSVLPAT